MKDSVTKHIDSVTIDIIRLDDKLEESETKFTTSFKAEPVKPFDPNNTVVAIGIPYEAGENLNGRRNVPRSLITSRINHLRRGQTS